MQEPPIDPPAAAPLNYEPKPEPTMPIWPSIMAGLGLVLFLAAAVTPFLFRFGVWIVPLGVVALIVSGCLVVVADQY